MEYDPIKRRLGNVFNRTPFLRKLFYSLLDLLLLRAWHVFKELRSLKKRSFSGKIRILDAGSGFGQYSYRLSRIFAGSIIKGVDVKQEQIDDCNRFFNSAGLQERVNFEYADLTEYSEPYSYDLILSVDVMEHIEEDELVFNNFYKSLRNNGVLLISTPSDQGGSDTNDHDQDAVHGFIEEHVRDGYGIDDISQKLNHAGFSDVEVRYTYGTTGSLSWKFSMKYPILMLGKSKLFFILLPLYYLITFPFCVILNYSDVIFRHKKGTGLLVKAYKK
ncbi:MAG: class I SAM-dependent methyltransferase [Bacteroidia bacterium]|nr:class I SAM-dependent methyltransferase [Bacteroidia bacterium]